MAEQKPKYVTFVIERQDGPEEKPYTQEFDVPYNPSRLVDRKSVV